MSISSAGTPVSPTGSTAGDPIAGTWGTGQNRTSGNLLVALVTGFGSTGAGGTSQFTGTSGWTKQYEGNSAHSVAAIWTKNATGGDAAPSFLTNVSGTHQETMCALYELTDSLGSLPVVDTGGTATGASSIPLTVTTSGNVAGAAEYALGTQSNGNTFASETVTWGSAGGNWTTAFHDSSTLFGHWVVATQSSPTPGATLSYAPSYTYSSNSPTDQAGAVLVVKGSIPPSTSRAFLAFFP